eukprot:1992122-Pleurochrysis_carterae.AAC.7
MGFRRRLPASRRSGAERSRVLSRPDRLRNTRRRWAAPRLQGQKADLWDGASRQTLAALIVPMAPRLRFHPVQIRFVSFHAH